MRGRGAVWTGKSFDFGVGRTSVKYRDDGWLQIVNNMFALDSSRVKVGVVGKNANIRHPSGLSMADIAAINEYGTEDGHVPSRSFLRTVLRSAKAHAGFRRAATDAARGAITKRAVAVSTVLGAIGRWAVEEIKTNIANTIPPEQADATIAKKGHDGTLRETFALYNAINFVITTWKQHLKGDSGGPETKVDTETSDGSFGDTKGRLW